MQLKISMILLLSLLIIVSSCEKEKNAEFTDTPIIESYLKPGDYLNVKVSRQIPFSSEVTYAPDDINNLKIEFIINDITHTLQPLGNGNYIDSSFIVSENDNFNLLFQFNSSNVKAYTFVPAKPTNITQSDTIIYIEKIEITTGAPGGPPPNMGAQPEPVKVTWSNPNNSYYLIMVENMESTLEAIRDFGDEAPPGNIFRKQPTSASSDEIRANEFQYYGRHRIIIHHVLPDYAALYNQSSTSSQNLTNPSTSITNGYGIFTGLNSDTLIVDVKKP